VSNNHIIKRRKKTKKKANTEFISWDDDLTLNVKKRQTYQSVRDVSSFCGDGGGDSGLLLFVDDIVLVSRSFGTIYGTIYRSSDLLRSHSHLMICVGIFNFVLLFLAFALLL
jgi:hypothetical protein